MNIIKMLAALILAILYIVGGNWAITPPEGAGKILFYFLVCYFSGVGFGYTVIRTLWKGKWDFVKKSENK